MPSKNLDHKKLGHQQRNSLKEHVKRGLEPGRVWYCEECSVTLALGKARAYVADLRGKTVHPFHPEEIRSRIEEVVARLVGLPAPGPRFPSP